jgi:hypothetical protein
VLMAAEQAFSALISRRDAYLRKAEIADILWRIDDE